MSKKKLIVAVLCAVLVITLCAIIFIPGGVELTDKQIEDRMLYNRLCNEAYEICLENTPELYKKSLQSANRDDVVEQLEFDITVCNLLSEKKIAMHKSDTDSIAKAEYEAMQTDPQQTAYKEALFKVLEKENVSEQRYLELLCEAAYYRYNTLTLEKDFEHTGYDENSDEDFETQFREYVEDNM